MRMHYGVLTPGSRAAIFGTASYIATGRSFSALNSNFVHLYHLYARSHFYFAIWMACLTIFYGFVTELTGYYGWTTWGIWMIIVSLLLAPWLFNPQSFNWGMLQTNFLEFLNWIDCEPGLSQGMGSWHKWNIHSRSEERKANGLKRAARYCLAVLQVTPLFLCCIAGIEARLLLARYTNATRVLATPALLVFATPTAATPHRVYTLPVT